MKTPDVQYGSMKRGWGKSSRQWLCCKNLVPISKPVYCELNSGFNIWGLRAMGKLKGRLYRVWISYGRSKNHKGSHEITREVTAMDVVSALKTVAGIDPDIPEVTVATIEQVADLDRVIQAEDG